MQPAEDGRSPNRSGVRAFGVPWLERVALGVVCILLGALGSAHLNGSNIGVGINLPTANHTEIDEPRRPPLSPPAPSDRFRVVGLATFGNGSSRLSGEQLANVRRWALALSRCKGAEVSVHGSTSSASYKEGSLRSNQWLGVQRAEVVAAAIRSEGNVQVTVVDAESVLGLEALRGFSDVIDSTDVEELAAVARRVDMEVQTFGSCALLPERK